MTYQQNKKQIIINCEKLETRVAFLNRGKLDEYEIERPDREILAGSIYLGKIVNLEPSLEAAFVDIGAEKNAFLHYSDMLPATYDMIDNLKTEENVTKKLKSSFTDKLKKIFSAVKKDENDFIDPRSLKGKITAKDIPSFFPAGSRIMVQVTKGPIGTKGARITTNITIPGRYLVLLPYSEHIGLSSKIDDPKERDRLRKILLGLELPEKIGLICRTVGEGRKAIFFKRDLDMLLDLWNKMDGLLKSRPKCPALVYKEPGLIERTVRDFLTEDIDEIVTDNPDAFNTIHEMLLKLTDPKTAAKAMLYKKSNNVFEQYGVNKQIDLIFQRQVPLPNGAYICIDETEALVAIDVNTGKSRNYKDQPEAILQTNLEAAEEVARHMKLRNVGGLVVIDFIDMRSQKDRDAVYKHMKKLVADDKAKTTILPISRLGLMEMTRQREHESISATIYDSCPYCHGSGKVKSAFSMSVEIQRRLLNVLKKYRRERGLAVRVILHPAIFARLKNEDANILAELEHKYGKDLSFRADPTLHVEEFRLVDPETNEEFK